MLFSSKNKQILRNFYLKYCINFDADFEMKDKNV